MLTKSQLSQQLFANGHAPSASVESETAIRVWPKKEIIVTVGNDTDAVLDPQFRQNYFACIADDEFEPLIQHNAEFDYRGIFGHMAKRIGERGEFIRGALRWFFRRIETFASVLLWPDRGFRGDDGCGFLPTLSDGTRTENLPRLADWLRGKTLDFSQLGAIALALDVEADCEVLWEVANHVAECVVNDFYVADTEVRQVYMLHHHDKIVISIPAVRPRHELLDELKLSTDVFENCSNYG